MSDEPRTDDTAKAAPAAGTPTRSTPIQASQNSFQPRAIA